MLFMRCTHDTLESKRGDESDCGWREESTVNPFVEIRLSTEKKGFEIAQWYSAEVAGRLTFEIGLVSQQPRA